MSFIIETLGADSENLSLMIRFEPAIDSERPATTVVKVADLLYQYVCELFETEPVNADGTPIKTRVIH